MKQEPLRFVVAGGGTGGHVIPALAVANELRRRGHEVMFVGTRQGMESKLVPAAGYRVEWIEIGGLKRVGWSRAMATLFRLPMAIARLWRLMGRWKPAVVFSTGGFVAGPAMVAGWLRRIPVVAMEPNAMPGFTHRTAARLCRKVLLGVAEAARYFPAGRTEVTGIPVREEFFAAPDLSPGHPARVLITGGSQGSRTLNQAFQQSWPLFRESGLGVRFLHQCGKASFEPLRRDFAESGLQGEVAEFIEDMPAAFAGVDMVVCRAGAGTVAELAASGRPAILVPFPYAADDHQRHNAEAMERAGAARMVPDREMDGARLFAEVSALLKDPEKLRRMGKAARGLARPGSAARAAEILEETGGKRNS
jgi:UDP-N-acetylglucosamine--N-acetylmuramyl-(pentapeptide) pyrophosphoryl-undecaprenol N-acetylglucosamine transferase